MAAVEWYSVVSVRFENIPRQQPSSVLAVLFLLFHLTYRRGVLNTASRDAAISFTRRCVIDSGNFLDGFPWTSGAKL
jgi:hypothetical protein